MVCKKCNLNNDSDAKFCQRCGHPFETEQASGAVDIYFNKKNESLIDGAKKLADKEIMYGVIIFLVALGISFGSYMFASNGGTYYVGGGAIIYGLYRFIRGIGYKINPGSLLDKAEAQESKKERK